MNDKTLSEHVDIPESVVRLTLDVSRPRAIEVVCERIDGKAENKQLVVNRRGKVHLE